MASLVSQIDASISKGLDFLAKSQLPYGEFKTYISFDKSMEGECILISNVYSTTFIIYSLSFLSYPIVDLMTKKSLAFFTEEMKYPGVWKFYTSCRNIKFVNGNIIKFSEVDSVPDLDDTSCVSFCLKKNGVDFPSNLSIFTNNMDSKGLFKTWLLEMKNENKDSNFGSYYRPQQNDICIGVISNILLYLGENLHTENAVKYIINCVLDYDSLNASKYFSDRVVLYYLISRAFYNGISSLAVLKDFILNEILQFKKNQVFIENPLYCSLSLCALLNYGFYKKDIIELVWYLLNSQSINGHWQKFGFYSGLIHNVFYGSNELTTAFCLEALSRSKEGFIS